MLVTVALSFVAFPMLAWLSAPRTVVHAQTSPSPTFYGAFRPSNGTTWADFLGPLMSAADTGNYFHASTNTPGTAYTLTGATQTGFVATTPTFVMTNGSASVKVYPDYVRFNMATAGTAGTRIEAVVVIDSAARYSSGGTALTAYNTNMNSAIASVVTPIEAGAVTATAATAPRYVCRGVLKTAIPAAGDTYLIKFSSDSDSGTTIQQAISCPAVVLGQNQSLLVYTWLPSQSAAPTGEVTGAWLER